jgi:hypothetical protein
MIALLLALVATAASLVGVLVDTWKDLHKSKTHKRIASTFYTVAALGTSGVLISQYGSAQRDAADALNWRKEERLHLSRIDAEGGNDEAMRSYLQQELLLQGQVNDAERHEAERQFFASPSTSEGIREQRKTANDKIVRDNFIRFEPITNFVLSTTIDDWIAGAQKHNPQIGIEKAPSASVISGQYMGGFIRVRSFMFPNKMHLDVMLLPAAITDSQFEREMIITMELFSPDGKADSLWTLSAGKNSYTVANIRPARYGYRPYTGTLAQPIDDPMLSKTITVSLNEVMKYVLSEATAPN